MKKALITIVAALAVMASVPTMSVQALDPPMKGDLNTDFQVNMSDLVLMQRYLLGQCDLEPIYAIYAADVNDDGNADIFDFILMKQMVNCDQSNIKVDFTSCADSVPEGMVYGKQPFEESAVITSVSELEEYFQPYFVLLTTGKDVIIEVATQDVIDDFMERYDKEFFSENVLCLNYLRNSSHWGVKSVEYNDSDLTIKYYDETPDYLNSNVAPPPVIASAVVPKNLWADGNAIWEEVEEPFTPQIKTDFTNAITTSAIECAVSDTSPAVILNTSEFESFIDGKFGYGVEKSLKSTYTEDYFNNNVMIFDLYYQGYDKFQTNVSVEKNKNGEIEVIYNKMEDVVGEAADGIKLSIVSIPKEQYHGGPAVRTKTWETPINASYQEFDLGMISDALRVDIPWLDIDGSWISSQEEFETLFKEALPTDVYETINMSVENIDWSKKSAYIGVDHDVIGSNHRLLSASERENELVLKFASKQPLSCMGGQFFHITTVDKEYEGSIVNCKNLNFNEDIPMIGGEYQFLPIGDNYTHFLIDQYTFGDENVADVYLIYPGGGPSRFNGYKYLGSIDLPLGYYGFSSLADYTQTENEDGSKSASVNYMTALNYHDENGDPQVKITFTLPDSGEIIEKTFAY